MRRNEYTTGPNTIEAAIIAKMEKRNMEIIAPEQTTKAGIARITRMIKNKRSHP